MNTKIGILIAIVVIIIIGAFIVNDNSNSITSASIFVDQKTQCVEADEALRLINEKGCERIYEDSECAEQGLVKVKC